MKPDVSVYFGELVRSLREDLAPKLPTAFEQGAALRLAMLSQAASEEFDRAAARRFEENEAMRRLFESASSFVKSPDLLIRLQNVGSVREESIHVSELERVNQMMRVLLIELHAHVELLAGDDARDLEREIWSELSASTERRAVSIGRF